MSDGERARDERASDLRRSDGRTGAWLIALAVVALVAGLIGRAFVPAQQRSAQTSARPIVQFVRGEDFPSIADEVERLCPSIATIITNSGSALGTTGAPAFVVSADGWLLAPGPLEARSQLQAQFSNGDKVVIDEVRSDPVSGLSVAHADIGALMPLPFSDQAFARVGDFGFSLQSANGAGCTAQWAMIGGDSLTDANAKGLFIRPQPGSPPFSSGTPLFGDHDTVLGVASARQGNLLPGPIATSIVDELIRGTPSPITRFGFRAVDFSPNLATRVGNARARGAGVALIQPNSSADKAGLRAGDVVVAVDGSPVSSASELARDLDAESGAATLQVARGDKQLQLKVAQVAD